MKSLCFGAILWDIIEKKEYLGGAPFNLAVHLKKLGSESHIVSTIGDDDRGERIRREIERHGLCGTYVQTDPVHPTGYVTVMTDAEGQSFYTIHEQVAFDYIDVGEKTASKLADEDFDVFCFGTVEQRSSTTRRSLFRILETIQKRDHSTAVFCDLNLRQPYFSREVIQDSLKYCDILKLNEEEAAVISDLIFPELNLANNCRNFCVCVSETYGLELVVITRGSDGCVVFGKNVFFEQPGQAVCVVDTVGPGDAFSAAFLQEYLTTRDAHQAAFKANLLGAYVASKRGALPDYSNEINRTLGIIP